MIVMSAVAAMSQTKRYRFVNGQWVEEVVKNEETALAEAAAAIASEPLRVDTTLDVTDDMLPTIMYLPAVFGTYEFASPDGGFGQTVKPADQNRFDRLIAAHQRGNMMLQDYMIDNASKVRYNIATLPEAPKQYVATVDPSTARVTVKEIVVNDEEMKGEVETVEVKRRHWLHDFTGLIQFSQAYNSPNWYQGGNNNLNMIINGVWKVKLNPAFHPNLLFENTVAYKLALNSAPDDSLRNYSISEDLLQINTKFGVKAFKNWYYSVTMQFKTQLLNNYKTNTRDLTAAFLSPSELNVGLGMTYASSGKRYKFNASVAPLSYNIKTCTNSRINPASFGIPDGKQSVSQMGSNIDCNLVWNIAYNITFTSRLTAFTDYGYLQSDWENTLAFNINRFLSTQLYAHLRYDSQGATYGDTRWRKWQVKEILSFGFSYKFGSV